MIKACHIVSLKVPNEDSKIFLEGSEKLEVLKGGVLDISKLFFSDLKIILYLNDQIISTSKNFVPSLLGLNEVIDINLHNDSMEFCQIKLLFSCLPPEIFKITAANSNNLASLLARTSKELKTVKKSNKNLQEENETLKAQIKNLEKDYKNSVNENLEFKEKLVKLEISEKNSIEASQILLQENLELQSEVIEVHRSYTEQEFEIKARLKQEQQKVNDLYLQIADLSENHRKSQFMCQRVKLENEDLLKKLKKSAEGEDLPLKKSSFIRKSFPKKKTEKFWSYLSQYRLESDFERVSEDTYIYGNKKIFVSSKNDVLLVKVGNKELKADEFFKSIIKERGVYSQTPIVFKESFESKGFDLEVLKENVLTPSPRVIKNEQRLLSSGKRLFHGHSNVIR